MINRILLDKNIAIDLISGRPRKNKIIETLNNFDQLNISTNTFTTCFYVLRKEYSKEEIYDHLSKFEILEINKTDCNLAYSLAKNINDIEDCLEIFTAKRNDCQILTADKNMEAKYGGFFEMIVV